VSRKLSACKKSLSLWSINSFGIKFLAKTLFFSLGLYPNFDIISANCYSSFYGLVFGILFTSEKYPPALIDGDWNLLSVLPCLFENTLRAEDRL